MSKKIKSITRILNCIPSLNTDLDWRMEHAVGSGILAAAPAIPSSKDLRETWWEINDQKATGSCVGWATADSVIRWHFVKANQLPQDQLLSPRFIWMASKETDQFVSYPSTFIELEGTSLKAALDIARKFGNVLDSELLFDSGKLYQKDAQTFYALAAQRKIASYFNLKINAAQWRVWLATHGPILTRLNVDATWENAKATHGNLDKYQSDSTRGGHAVSLVGYTSDRFIVRNSWGEEWGDEGFGYASIDYALAAFTEAYGVTI